MFINHIKNSANVKLLYFNGLVANCFKKIVIVFIRQFRRKLFGQTAISKIRSGTKRQNFEVQ